MSKFSFNKKKMEILLREVFPDAKIKSFKKFSTGMVSPAFKVQIANPNKTVVIKLGKIKNEEKIRKNNKILSFLKEEEFPVPSVLLEKSFLGSFITVASLSPGNAASDVYEKSGQRSREKILISSGRWLKRIHSLKIKSFWVSQKHEIKNKTEWKKWTRQRIDKYLKFFRNKLPDNYKFIESELETFWNILEKEKIDFVPLHWDYHLSNLNVDRSKNVSGIFDFDGSIKGHSLADIGTSAYFLRFFMKDYKNFGFFLNGYKKNFTKNELALIRGYFLLQMLAVSRSIWFRKDLKWIIKDHQIILDEFKCGSI